MGVELVGQALIGVAQPAQPAAQVDLDTSGDHRQPRRGGERPAAGADDQDRLPVVLDVADRDRAGSGHEQAGVVGPGHHAAGQHRR